MNIKGILFVVLLSAAAAALALAPGSIVSGESSTPLPSEKPAAAVMSPNNWEPIVGPELINADGETVLTADLETEYLAVYFSASWCPPCRLVLAPLKKFYQSSSQQVTIVLAGMDQSAEKRGSYYRDNKMPWLSLPFDSAASESLASKLRVRGVPSMFVFQRDGQMVTDAAVRDITADPASALGKWKSKHSPAQP